MFTFLEHNTQIVFVLASLLFIIVFFSFRYYEKMWFPPSSIFFFGFVSATFLYSLSIYVFEIETVTIQYANMGKALVYSLVSFFFLFVGYLLSNLFSPTYKNFRIIIEKPIFSARSMNLAFLILILLLIINIINHPLITGQDAVRGENSYLSDSDISVWYRITFIASQLIIPFSISILISSLCIKGKAGKRAKRISIIALALVVLLTLLSFDRHAAVSSILLAFILFHYRVKSLKFRTVIMSFFLLIFLQTVRLFRNIGSYVAISYSQILEIFGSIDISLLLVGPFTALGGWDVFTNIFDLVPAQDSYKFGLTYLNSILGLLSPRALGLGSYEVMTPSRWYMELYAPGTTNHGYDFSILAETYMNFGFFGPLVFLPIGFFVSCLSKNIRYAKSAKKIFFSLIALEALTFGMRMDSNAIVKAMVYKVLPVLIIAYFCNLLTCKKNSINTIEK